MRNHDNMPVLDWNDDKAPLKARAQILHQEPVILQMPEDFDTAIDGDELHCQLEEKSDILYDCDGGRTLERLAARNHLDALHRLAEACVRSNSQVDIDRAHRRLIVHD